MALLENLRALVKALEIHNEKIVSAKGSKELAEKALQTYTDGLKSHQKDIQGIQAGSNERLKTELQVILTSGEEASAIANGFIIMHEETASPASEGEVVGAAAGNGRRLTTAIDLLLKLNENLNTKMPSLVTSNDVASLELTITRSETAFARIATMANSSNKVKGGIARTVSFKSKADQNELNLYKKHSDAFAATMETLRERVKTLTVPAASAPQKTEKPAAAEAERQEQQRQEQQRQEQQRQEQQRQEQQRQEQQRQEQQRQEQQRQEQQRQEQQRQEQQRQEQQRQEQQRQEQQRQEQQRQEQQRQEQQRQEQQRQEQQRQEQQRQEQQRQEQQRQEQQRQEQQRQEQQRQEQQRQEQQRQEQQRQEEQRQEQQRQEQQRQEQQRQEQQRQEQQRQEEQRQEQQRQEQQRQEEQRQEQQRQEQQRQEEQRQEQQRQEEAPVAEAVAARTALNRVTFRDATSPLALQFAALKDALVDPSLQNEPVVVNAMQALFAYCETLSRGLEEGADQVARHDARIMFENSIIGLPGHPNELVQNIGKAFMAVGTLIAAALAASPLVALVSISAAAAIALPAACVIPAAVTAATLVGAGVLSFFGAGSSGAHRKAQELAASGAALDAGTTAVINITAGA